MVRDHREHGDPLAPSRQPLRHLSGSQASFGFFNTEHPKSAAAPLHVTTDKFVMSSGHDPLTPVTMPDHEAAYAFNMPISTEAGLKFEDLVPILPMQDAVKAMAAAKPAVAQTGHPAPGRARP